MGKSKNKKNLTTLAKNIKALREAFGETLKDLANIVGYGTNTVHYYETGRNEPDDETKSKIAKHFGVTVSELLHSDLTNIDRIHVDFLAFYHNLNTVFPIVCTENALKNESFAKAYRLHNNLYGKAKELQLKDFIDTNSSSSFIDTIADTMDEIESIYSAAYNDVQIQTETAVNLIACLLFPLCIIKGTLDYYEGKQYSFAPFMLISKQFPSLKQEMTNTEQLSDDEKNELTELVFDRDTTERIDKMKTIAKKKYSDIVYYYTALQFIFDLVGNDLEQYFNERIGKEMLDAFETIGNKYAAKYNEYDNKRFSTKVKTNNKERK